MSFSRLLILICIFTNSNFFAQCEEPVLTGWSVAGEENYDVSFTLNETDTPFLVKFTALYSDGPFQIDMPEMIFEGQSVLGEQTESYDLSAWLESFGTSALSQYLKVDLGSICESDTLWIPSFYMSESSQFNNSNYQCDGQLFTPFAYLADGAGFVYEIEFYLDGGSGLLQIDQMSFLIEIGHTYCGDLSLALISPAGTIVSLLDVPNGLGSAKGFSVLFADGFGPVEATMGISGEYVSGIYGPSESFSAFEGEVLTGTWRVRITDNAPGDEGYLFGLCAQAETSPCNTSVEGKVFFDINSNNILDVNEPLAEYSYISMDPVEDIITDVNGAFVRCFDPVELDFTIENPNIYYQASPESYSLDLELGDSLTDINFALQPIEPEIEDIQLNILMPNIPDRPGFTNSYVVHYNNIGTTCVNDVELSFTVPDGVSLNVVSSVFPSSILDGTGIISVGTLCPFDSGEIIFHILVDTAVVMGDELFYEALITPILEDENDVDNQDFYVSEVVSSFDPNDKLVSHAAIGSDFIEDEKSLEYLIRFQNTGNFNAVRVELVDEIEEDLMMNSLEIINSSHPLEVWVEEDKLHFLFDNIILPAEQDDPEGSQGFVRFKMRPSPTFSLGDVIHNSAEIYFDFNSPVLTDSAITVFDPLIGIREKQNLEFNVYPNPIQDLLMVDMRKLMDETEINIFSALGERVHTLKINNLRLIEINTNSFKPGIYFIELKNVDGLIASRKIIKLE